MEKVQYMARSALRRASTIEVNPQARQRLQELFVNFCLILICLLLICIIVMLLWSSSTSLHCPLGESPPEGRHLRCNSQCKDPLVRGASTWTRAVCQLSHCLLLPATCIKNTLLLYSTVFRACCYKAVHDLMSQSRDDFSEWGKVPALHGVGKFLNVLATSHKWQLHFCGGQSVFRFF